MDTLVLDGLTQWKSPVIQVGDSLGKCISEFTMLLLLLLLLQSTASLFLILSFACSIQT